MSYSDPQTINLIIKDHVFITNKNVLCAKSDYFKAMFRGYFMESNMKDITISVDAVDTDSMTTILQYLEGERKSLFDHEQQAIINLAVAADYLQIADLSKLIENTLEVQVTAPNFLEILEIAEDLAFEKLAQSALCCGLRSFKIMHVEVFPTIHKLVRYLSHPNLEMGSELDVFKFGLRWIQCKKAGADALMIVLGCLDWNRASLNNELYSMINLIKNDYQDSKALMVLLIIVQLLLSVSTVGDLIKTPIVSYLETVMRERNILAAVILEAIRLATRSTERVRRACIPIVPMENINGKPELASPHLYIFTKNNVFKKWLEISDKNIIGWSLVQWGGYKLVMIGGRYPDVAGEAAYMTDIKIYNTYSMEWTTYEDVLTPIQNGIIAVAKNDLYILGGFIDDSVYGESLFVYNLDTNTHKKIMPLPNQCTAACSHLEKVYAAGKDQNIYKYSKQQDSWEMVAATNHKVSCMASVHNYIFCTLTGAVGIYTFEPGTDWRLRSISRSILHSPAILCNLTDCMISFNSFAPESSINKIQVEEILVLQCNQVTHCSTTVDSIGFTIEKGPGSCALFLEPPSLATNMSSLLQHYLSNYDNA